MNYEEGNLVGGDPQHDRTELASHRRLALGALQADVLRVIAFVAMIFDHWAKALHPDAPPRFAVIIGTIAFPTFLAVSGILVAQSDRMHWRRILIIGFAAIITQPLFSVTFESYFAALGLPGGVNILFSFLALSIIIWIIQGVNWQRPVHALAAVIGVYLVLHHAGPLLQIGAFGPFGLLVGIGFYLSAKYSLWWLVLALVPLWGFDADPVLGAGYFSTGLLITCFCARQSPYAAMSSGRFLPRHFFVAGYLGHLLLLLGLMRYL